MKDKRIYNVFYNLHTVSSITIAVGLFICFFAGAFALFKTNINRWEANVKKPEAIAIDYEKTLSVLDNEGYVLDGRNIFIGSGDDPKPYIMVLSQPSKKKDSLSTANNRGALTQKENELISLKLDPNTYKITDNKSIEQHGFLGTFIYELHYFEPIPKIGVYLSGILAMFFFLSIIAGTIIHWKKIVPMFFSFRIKNSIKQLWSSGHTALGIIGLPFQLMYAITGAFFSLSIIVFIPTANVLFNGEQGGLMEYIAPSSKYENRIEEPLKNRENLNLIFKKAKDELRVDDYRLSFVNITNFNYKNARASFLFIEKQEKSIFESAHIIYNVSDASIVEKKPFNKVTYQESVLYLLHVFHFGAFGGYFVKIIYFLLAMLTCFVIQSGVMLWLEARNNKKHLIKKKFNKSVVAIYTGICMGLFPSFALLFCVAKIFPQNIENRFNIITGVFFIFWLVYTFYAYLSNNLKTITRNALIIAALLGVFVPLLNGFQSGLWFWSSLDKGYKDSFFIDISWALFGLITFMGLILTKKSKKNATTSLSA
ncbi:PepSY-associated TM helix domain-containing protein [Flavivirga jejuensis]|uniref:PepSY-associated TM helix domain-containing protein n=1 Tax=Flavivirga jejuensis TaxID=870487 RepID=A0ABT8WSH7_9FLAO|nr:PepSY-associated TM helix domain-containing protein [Flavivirga jejuensis]MDO5976125.1 PepSY-associated TM helix domain-containing protein [Flavivirga jejuensis]